MTARTENAVGRSGGAPARGDAGDDRILAAANDLVGVLQIIRFGRGVYVRLGVSVALVVAAAVAVMVAARVLGRVVSVVVEGGREAVLEPAAWFFALELAAVALQYVGRLHLARATVEIAQGIRRELFAKMQRLPIQYYDGQPLGRTITRLTSDVEGMESFYGGTLAKVIIAIIQITVVLSAMLLTDPRFGALTVAASLPALWFTVALRKPVRNWLRAYKQRSAHINARLAEFLNGIPVIRAFGLEGWTQSQYDAAADSQLEAGLSTMNWNSFIRPVAILLCSVPTVVILWIGGQRVVAGVMEIGVLVAFVRYSERFSSPIRTVSQEIQRIQEALVSSERVRRMLTEPEEAAVLGGDGVLTPDLRGGIRFDDVWMGYDPARPVLKGLTFTVEPGMTVALVGATGSGKTSTVNLLPRLYPFQRGSLTLDGTDIRQVARAHLRAHLGYVGQDVVVFAGSIRDNLTVAVDGAVPDDRILAACRETGLDRVIANFADGLDHQLVDGGENLSMGERQLVAFTRMLLRDPRILILDEATANIDEECERLIQGATARLMRGRTSFVIAHRLSTIIQSDLILVFKDGRIVERGRHRDLEAADGYYAELVRRQMSPEALKTGGPPVDAPDPQA